MKFNQNISCIICCYNEQQTIGKVVKVALESGLFEEIIVVDDASTDNSASIVRELPVKLIQHKQNLGKGAAMATGIHKSRYDLLFFLDADLKGLNIEHLLRILYPIAFTHESDLVLGVFALKELGEDFNTKVANRSFPAITGQRAIWRKNLPDLDHLEKSRYGADYLITKNVPRKRRKVIKLEGLSQITKETKLDFPHAVKTRAKMYKEILKAIGD